MLQFVVQKELLAQEFECSMAPKPQEISESSLDRSKPQPQVRMPKECMYNIHVT